MEDRETVKQDESALIQRDGGVFGKRASTERERSRRKRRKREHVDPGRFDVFQSECTQLLQELQELETHVMVDYLQRHWFTGIRIFVNCPIHST